MIYIEERTSKQVPGITSLFVRFDYNKQTIEKIKECECRIYTSKTCEWELPLTCLSDLIYKLYEYDDIQLITLKDKPQQIENTVLEINGRNVCLYEHQKEAIQYGLQKDCWLLLDAPGLGKTLTIIYYAEELKRLYNIQHCLIVCGINNLKYNWKKEIEKYSNYSCVILGQRYDSKGRLKVGSVKDRLNHLKSNIEEFFIITNIETLRDKNIVKYLKSRTCKNKLDLMVIDEIHTCKNGSSRQGGNILKLKNIKYKVGLTGTLLLNNPLDAYLPLRWIGIERSSPSTFKYFYMEYGGKFNTKFLGYKNMDYLKYQLSTCSLRRKKETLNLPSKTIIEEVVEMSPPQTELYNNIVNNIVSEIDKVDISTTSLLSKILRLRQATACPSILTSEQVPSAKLDRVKELVDSIVSNGDKVVIFSVFKEVVRTLNTMLSDYSPLTGTGDQSDLEVSNNIEQFQTDSNCKVFIATSQKCGTGITLNAATYMIFVDTPWTDAVWTQAQDRIHRIGTTQPVFIYNLITKDTIDEKVVGILKTKKAFSDYVIDDDMSQEVIDQLKNYIYGLQQI